MTYHLRDGLSFCICADRVVFLDLRADRYFCLGAALEACFKRWAGAPAACHGTHHIALLCSEGLLVRGDDRLQTGHPASAPAVAGDVHAGSPARRRDVAEALVAQMMAAARLRYRPLTSIVERCRTLEHESAVHIERPRSGAEPIAAAFARSALLLGSFDRCLARAVAAKLVCRRRGVDATMVFGVRLNPFGAHCWVQAADRVIVGDYEQARLFTPILAVR